MDGRTEENEILRVLCGSRAYGLEDEASDWDYHGVFVVPTARFFEVGGPKINETSWVEGTTEDNTAWEVGHFLKLAIQCNPTILETFVAEPVKQSSWGDSLRKLFPAVLSKRKVYESFRGYGHNQMKKMLDEPFTMRNWKFAVAYLRVLLHAAALLKAGTYNPKVSDPTTNRRLREIKEGRWSRGEIIDWAGDLNAELTLAYGYSEMLDVPDLERINHWLLSLRTAYL